MRGPRGAVVLAVIAGTAVLGATETRPARQPAPDVVIEVRVEGNQFLTAEQVLVHVKVRPGRPYSEAVVLEDTQTLLKTRRFDSVTASKTQTDKGVIVTFAVKERPAVEAVGLEGNKSIKDKKLLELLTFAAGDPIDPVQIDAGARAILAKYRSGGHYFAVVTLDEQALKEKRRVLYRIEEGPKVTLRKISFRDNRAFSDRQLRGEIKSRSRWWPFRPGTLDAETIQRDVVDLRNFYHSKGYLDVEVGHRLEFSHDKRSAELIFVVPEGPRFRVRKGSFEGAAVFSADEIQKDVKLKPGEFYDGEALKRDTETVRQMYGRIGYIDVQVSVKPRPVPAGEPVPDILKPPPGEPAALVDLLYTIVESEQFTVGTVDIRGNKVTKDSVIRRHVQFFPGQLFNLMAAEETSLRLKETGLFEKVEVAPYGTAPGVRNALVRVEEGRTGRILVGAGISSIGLLGTVSFTEQNFDIAAWPRTWEDVRQGRAFKGGGQTFSISAQPGTEFSRFRIDWHEPYLFDRPYSLGTSLFLFTSGRETYDETRVGALASLGRMFKNRWYAEVTTRIENVDISDLSATAPPDVIADAGASSLLGIKGSISRDRTDSGWLPSRGDRVKLSYEQVMGDYVFGRTVADYHIYRTLYADALGRKHILAGRASAGVISGDSPVFERFYGGGLGSVRGFRYRGISPRQGPTAEVVGGDFMVFVGTEYTFPLVGEQLRGVVFLDTGTVETDASITDYRASAGLGVRLHLPFFGPVPMSLDFGVPISKATNDDTQIFSFSVGWRF